MKKLFVIIVFFFLLVACQRNEIMPDTIIITNDINTVVQHDDYTDSLDDLVYYDYGTGIKLSSNSTLTASLYDIDFDDELVIIYAIDLENKETIKLYESQANQLDHDITFTPSSDGVFVIIAAISNGEVIDLTPKAIVETTYTKENSNGLIPLN